MHNWMKYIAKKVKYIFDVAAIPVGLLLLWQILSSQGILLEVILPSPLSVLKALYEIVVDGTLKIDILTSLRRIMVGYFWGVVVAIVLGVVYRFIYPIINVIRQIPLYAWMPLLILWFGIGEFSKVLIIARGVVIPLYLNTVQGIRDVNVQYYELAKVLELKKKTFLQKIVFPSAMPSIYTGLRLAAGNALMAVVAAEMLGGLTGLGYALLQAKEFLWSDKLIALMLVIAVIGIIFDSIIKGIENRTLRKKQ